MPKPSRTSISELETLAPTLWEAACKRTYQLDAIVFGCAAGNFLLADEPGLGKTLETLGTIVHHTLDGTQYHLVLTPKIAMDLVWTGEVHRWLEHDFAHAYSLSGSAARRAAILTEALQDRSVPHVFIVANIEMAREAHRAKWPMLFSRWWDTIVVDEAHMALVKRPGSHTQTRRGIVGLRAGRRIAISGTPMRGKEQNLWGTLNWLEPKTYSSFWRWIKEYFHVDSTKFSGFNIGEPLRHGLDDMADDLKGIMLRRTKAEVHRSLPPKSYVGTYLIPDDVESPFGIWLPLVGEHRKQYREFESEAALPFKEYGTEIIANGTLAEYTRRKQLAHGVYTMEQFGLMAPTTKSPKYEWVLDFLGSIGVTDGQGEDKVVIVSQFSTTLKAYAKALRAKGIACHVLVGDTSPKERVRMVQDFQGKEGHHRVFLLNTKAGGVAVTLDAADHMVMLDETTIPDEQEQVENRIHRTSRNHPVTIYYLRTLDTQDEEIAWVTAARGDAMEYLMDGARGVASAKRYFEERRAGLEDSFRFGVVPRSEGAVPLKKRRMPPRG